MLGRIERVLLKKDTTVLPEEYEAVFQDHGIIRKYCKGTTIYDWKKIREEYIKPPTAWHFKFSPSKRIFIKKSKTGNILVKGEPNYRTNCGQYKGINKRGKTCNNMNKIPLVPKAVVKKEKLKDINNLLKKYFGQDWQDDQTLSYYRDLITTDSENHDGIVNDDRLCDINEKYEEPTVS